jgi:2-amino-4-hydroxy-6-hydroxymethyldihydropteridine diphosphokinase
MEDFHTPGDLSTSERQGCHGLHAVAIVGIGGNNVKLQTEARAAFHAALSAMAAHGIVILRTSSLYRTRALGGGWQPDYWNAVAEIEPRQSPRALLRTLKSIERDAGRRPVRRWGPRPLDIDIIDVDRMLVGSSSPRVLAGGLVLPHPEMHRRAFVIIPLLEIAPHWRHPRLNVGARRLLQRLTPHHRSGVRRIGALPSPPRGR